jgi:hypothetical protein
MGQLLYRHHVWSRILLKLLQCVALIAESAQYWPLSQIDQMTLTLANIEYVGITGL